MNHHNTENIPYRKFTKEEIANFIALAQVLKRIEIRKQLEHQYQSLSDTKPKKNDVSTP